MTGTKADRTPASRTPFVLLMVLLLGGGLLGLLLLNTALNQGSFDKSRLKRQNAELSDEEQALRQQLEAVSAPGELARKAEDLGMVPGTNPAFIDPGTGQVYGSAKPASPKPTPTPAASPPVPNAAGTPAPAPATVPSALPTPTDTTPTPPATFGPAPR